MNKPNSETRELTIDELNAVGGGTTKGTTNAELISKFTETLRDDVQHAKF